MTDKNKLDLYKAHQSEYEASSEGPQLVHVGRAQYLAIEGQGEPGGEAFQAAVGGLYGMAFTIKMARKLAGQGDYKVAPLEGLWWAEGHEGDFLNAPRDQWRWKLLVRTPGFVGPQDVQAAQESLRRKGKPPEFEQVRLESLEEGQCVQMLHVGPYATEPATLAKMAEFMREKALAVAGRHHEIYISDPRRTKPERLRTILRWPIKPLQ
jgi:hypothetical protein